MTNGLFPKKEEAQTMRKDFLLTTPMARRLYEEVARPLPVIDFHNHLSIADLASDRAFDNITDLWLRTDPYKHRAMRICGVPERGITGDAGDKEKFLAWCGIVPRLIGNPLYDWSNMEMRDALGVDIAINAESAEALWDKCNDVLSGAAFSTRGLFERFNVEYAAPCTGLTDDLGVFANLPGIVPSLRGDDILAPTPQFVRKLADSAGAEITDYAGFRRAVGIRLGAFARAGCRFPDHALDNGFRYFPDDGQNEARFAQLLREGRLRDADGRALTSDILRFLGGEYAGLGWVMQLHIGAERFTSSRLRDLVGGAGGFAGIGNCVDTHSLVALLDELERAPAGLPRTLLFTLNPNDNAVLAVLSGSFSQDGVAAKVSQGPAWWWCDHLQGMREMLEYFSAFSVLSTFVGMTSDSRNLLSFVRHEYFRRVLCGWMGEKAERGEYPDSFELLGDVVRSVCHDNAHHLLK